MDVTQDDQRELENALLRLNGRAWGISIGLVLAFVWIVAAMVRDRVVRGAVHPVLAWAGTGIIVEQSLETLMFDSPPWRVVAQWIYDLLRVVGGWREGRSAFPVLP